MSANASGLGTRALLCLVVVLFLASRVEAVSPAPSTETKPIASVNRRATILLHRIDRGDVIRTLHQEGKCEAADSSAVLCRVLSALDDPHSAPIKCAVENGTAVKKGDVLVELDTSILRERLRKQQKLVGTKRKAGVNPALQAAEEKLRELKNDLRECVMRAPQDGIVIYASSTGGRQALPARGEPVFCGQRLMSVSDLKNMLIGIRVRKELVPLLRKGQRAQIRLDSFPRLLSGRVNSVATSGDLPDFSERASGIVFSSVLIALEEAPVRVIPGVSADVSVIVGDRKAALRVPIQALVREGDKTFCLLKCKGGFQKRELVTGLSGDQFIEVKRGLQEGDVVILRTQADATRAPGNSAEPVRNGGREERSREDGQ